MKKLAVPILILGPTGQVGRALRQYCIRYELPFVAWGRHELDSTQPDAITDSLQQLRPGVIINAAAFTAVDLAETDFRQNFQVNRDLPMILAEWCAKHEKLLVHYSTDYVYPGTGEAPWQETDLAAPINAYGRAKLAGDEAIILSGAQHLILRTSWVYDEPGKNFVNTMINLGRERELIQVVNDQYGSPTYAADLAKATMQALIRGIERPNFPSGIYHLTNSGWTSWWHFAQEIFRQVRLRGVELKLKELAPIDSSQLVRPAPRPKNSRLDCHKFGKTFALELRPWASALAECLEAKYGS